MAGVGEGKRDRKIYLTTFFAGARAEFPDSLQVFEHLDISTDGSDQVGAEDGDVACVGEVDEGGEADYQVGREHLWLLDGDDRAPAVGDELGVASHISDNSAHLGRCVANSSPFTVYSHCVGT